MRLRLTTGKVANYKNDGKSSQSFLWDSDVSGFGIRATSGKTAYIYQGRFNGSPLRITIGDTTVWTIEDARAKARSYQAQIDVGRDPREIKKQNIAKDMATKEARALAAKEKALLGQLTLRALCQAYCDDLRSKGKIKSANDTLSAFRVHVFNSQYADVPAKAVTSKDISQIIRKVFAAGKERTAGILRNYLVAAYNTARKAPFDPKASAALIPFDITTNPAQVIATIPVKRGDRYLNEKELKRYLKALTNTPVDQLLRMQLFTGGQRISQLARAKPTDYQAPTGTLRLLDPKGRRNTAREHFIPLASKGQALIKRMTKGDEQLFASNEREAGARASQIAKEMGGEGFDLGDIRRTCETMLAGLGVSKEIRAQLLSHGIGGVQDAHYDRHGYIEEKRKALKLWETKLGEIEKGSR